MEFTNDIYFNDNLENGKTANITYSGDLFKSGSEHVNIVYGFSQNWYNTTTQPMKKTENGFVADITMLDYDTFNFCFSNENNIWDNNNNNNYISKILPKKEISKENIDFGADYASAIDDIIENILGNTVQNTIANDNDSDNVDNILEAISNETLPEVEELFDELFSAEFEKKSNVNNIVTEQKVSEESKNLDAELINLFNELFENSNEPVYIEKKQTSTPITESENNAIEVSAFNLDGLVSELLEPVISKTIVNNDNEISLFDDIKNDEDDEETSLTVVNSKDLLVSSRRLSNLYRLKKRIKLAFYKLFIKVPKQIAKQFGISEN